MNFIDEVKHSFRQNNNHTILIYINLIVFAIVTFFTITAFLVRGDHNFIIYWLGLPASFETLILKPWTIVSYMFTHQSFLHILFNLLFFFWFGKIFVQYLDQKKLLGLYILGGLVGGVVYVLAFNIFPVFEELKDSSIAIGASASVMAIIIAVATLVPRHTVFMLFFGQVQIRYIAIAVVIIDILSIPTDNAGGHIAHLGGALTGFAFIYYYKKGTDITTGVFKIIKFFKELFVPDKNIRVKSRRTKHRKPETDYEYNARKKAEQEGIDKILDKIAKDGYKSLTDKEKEKLFKSSNNKR